MQYSARPEPADKGRSKEKEAGDLNGVAHGASRTAVPWSLRALPERYLPYAYLMRLDKPIGMLRPHLAQSLSLPAVRALLQPKKNLSSRDWQIKQVYQ